ncbi:hypothetical protein J6590_009303 [Homalodisca vitripennis]|nr:hypothetical protein J6590_009303 [Homalodisca vitripennis]
MLYTVASPPEPSSYILSHFCFYTFRSVRSCVPVLRSISVSRIVRLCMCDKVHQGRAISSLLFAAETYTLDVPFFVYRPDRSKQKAT